MSTCAQLFSFHISPCPLQNEFRYSILVSVFHRILDFTRGWISIRPFSFPAYLYASPSGFFTHVSRIIDRNKIGNFCHCSTPVCQLLLCQKLIDSDINKKSNTKRKAAKLISYRYRPVKFLYQLKSKLSKEKSTKSVSVNFFFSFPFFASFPIQTNHLLNLRIVENHQRVAFARRKSTL